MIQPERGGAAWTDTKDEQLLSALRQKKTIKEIAAVHKRTSVAIYARIKRLIIRFHTEGGTVAEIQERTGLSKGKVTDAIASYQPSVEEEIVEVTVEDRGTQTESVPYEAILQEIAALLRTINQQKQDIVAVLQKDGMVLQHIPDQTEALCTVDYSHSVQ